MMVRSIFCFFTRDLYQQPHNQNAYTLVNTQEQEALAERGTLYVDGSMSQLKTIETFSITTVIFMRLNS